MCERRGNVQGQLRAGNTALFDDWESGRATTAGALIDDVRCKVAVRSVVRHDDLNGVLFVRPDDAPESG